MYTANRAYHINVGRGTMTKGYEDIGEAGAYHINVGRGTMTAGSTR